VESKETDLMEVKSGIIITRVWGGGGRGQDKERFANGYQVSVTWEV
jgi:hypothetical protein